MTSIQSCHRPGKSEKIKKIKIGHGKLGKV